VNLSSRNPHELVIVYGANGFLGSVITKRLHNSGIAVLAVVRPISDKSRIESIKNLAVIEEESFNWPQLIEKYKPGAVICAQWRGVSKSDREDLEIQESNILPIIDLAKAALASSVQTFICFGSQAESQKSIQKIAEEIYNSGTTAYGRVKAQLQSNLDSIFNQSNCRFIWARVFSVYGPSDTSDSLLMRLHESESQGIKLKIENPDTLWSFLYEDDFAAAVERILQSTEIVGNVNIGNPQLVKIQSIVDTWFEAPHKPSIRLESDMASEGFFPELRKLKSIGWTSGVSLEEGIQRTREAYKRRLNSNY
jgi:UDP-glucose 4-epimerase